MRFKVSQLGLGLPAAGPKKRTLGPLVLKRVRCCDRLERLRVIAMVLWGVRNGKSGSFFWVVKAALVTLRAYAQRTTKGSSFERTSLAIAGDVPHCYLPTWPESFLVSHEGRALLVATSSAEVSDEKSIVIVTIYFRRVRRLPVPRYICALPICLATRIRNAIRSSRIFFTNLTPATSTIRPRRIDAPP